MPEPVSDARALIEAALSARAFAFAPFSPFRVGAAPETSEGRILTGCKVESASYGLTIWAERGGGVKGVSQGDRSFRRSGVGADTATPTPPCGACRQLLWE